jgi:CubicO group peptidase (beta-lactamase class C family)
MRATPIPVRSLAALALVLTLTLASAPPAAAAAEAGLNAELDARFAQAYPADGPGAAVLVKKGDEVILRKGYGMADLELGVPVAPEMVFRLGSITKQFTGAAILLLVRDGKLALDASVAELLPGYEGPAGPVTVHQLLTHTGGVPSYTDVPEYVAGMREDVTTEQMIERFREKPLDFDPGTGWHYSNSGYFLLGRIIEEVSGESYEDFVETRIFGRLGMERTRYDKASELVPGRVEGYQGSTGAYQNAAFLSMTQPYAAGSLLSTVEDLARWDEALRDDELLTPELRELLWTPAELDDGRATGYGYGFVVHDYQGHRLVEHGGGINGFVTSMLRIPDQGIFVAVLSNNPAADPGPGALALEAATRVLGKPLEARPSVALDPGTLDEYVGVYAIEPLRGGPAPQTEQVRVVTREGGQLFTQRSGGAKSAVSFSEEDRIFYSDSLTTARFVRDDESRVTGMWMRPPVGAEEYAAKTDRPIPEERQEAEIDPALLDRYPGRYELVPGFRIDVTREGDQLFAQATGQPRFELFPETETRFFLKVVDAAIEFHGADDGQADALTLFQGGREMPGKRVED